MRSYVAGFLFFYWMLVLLLRMYYMQTLAVYEFFWACNIAMFCAIYGLWKDKPLVVNLAVMCISCD